MPSTLELPLPIHLPQELVDHVLSFFISLHDYDPAYQWTCLRTITRFHRRQIEHHFLHYWLPKLKITLYANNDSILLDTVEFRAWGLQKRTGLIRFKVHEGPQSMRNWFWAEKIMKTTYPHGDEPRREKRLVLRLGEGVLNRGFAGGGIISDVMLPGLKVDDTAENIWFDWKAMFSKLFGEEMVMRRLRDGLLAAYVPTIRSKHPKERHTAICDFLNKKYKPLRRFMLTRYRDHLSYHDTPFDISPYVTDDQKNGNWPVTHFGWYPSIYDFIRKYESMIYHIPGNRSWSVREIARLRAKEEMDWYSRWRTESSRNWAIMREQGAGTKEKWDRWLGNKVVDVKQLREELKVVRTYEDTYEF